MASLVRASQQKKTDALKCATIEASANHRFNVKTATFSGSRKETTLAP
jgi:hypothetical protein